MSEVWIDDIDLADYGFVLGRDPGQDATPTMSDAVVTPAGGFGPLWAGEAVAVQSRTLVISGHMRVDAGASSYRSTVVALRALVSNGAKRIRFSDRTDQEFRDARMTQFAPAPAAAILSTNHAAISITFECADPARYDVNPQGLALSTTRVSCPMGDAPTYPLIVAHGNGAALTNLVITVRDASGTVVQTMTFTNTIGANDYRIIDCLRTQITKSVAGTQSDAQSEWTSGDFPVLRPADAVYAVSAWPTIELSSSTGTAVGVASYSRAWL